MDSAKLLPLLEQLDDNVDDLEDILQPILSSSLLKSSDKLPVMDKARLHVFMAYTLESLIFSFLRLHRDDAKEHPVFRELTRVRQYFEKIQALETEPEERNLALDKAAAGRFIKHGLAGNDKYDLERAEKQAKERARAEFKAAMLAKKRGVDSGSAAESQVDAEDPDKADKEINKEKAKAHKGNRKSRKGKLDKTALKEEKKGRRQKKEEARKARKTQ
ncbi:hypothetical protein N7535_008005 [Penicillium sp. DV-2018c]|nr:hypothetical protein N7461_004040 [Penicillium sp. DV-2018c]KAJ5566367.1 hypothetical protein N7535_008005 [Penicillium sp. DV-2018c]